MLRYIACLCCVQQTHSQQNTHICELTSERWSTCWFLIRCPSPGSWLPCSAAAEPQPVADSHCRGTSLEGRGKEWGGRGGDAERDSGSLTYSAATYGDKSDVKIMIGDDGERGRREKETDRSNEAHRQEQRFTVSINPTDIHAGQNDFNSVKGELEMAKR